MEKKILLFNQSGLKTSGNGGSLYLNVSQGKQIDKFLQAMNDYFKEKKLPYKMEVDPSNKSVKFSDYSYILPYPGLSGIVKSKLSAEDQKKMIVITMDELKEGKIDRIIQQITG